MAKSKNSSQGVKITLHGTSGSTGSQGGAPCAQFGQDAGTAPGAAQGVKITPPGTSGSAGAQNGASCSQFGQDAGAAHGAAQGVKITPPGTSGSAGSQNGAPCSQFGQDAGAAPGAAQGVKITPPGTSGSAEPQDGAPGAQSGQSVKTNEDQGAGDKFVSYEDVRDIFLMFKAEDRHCKVTAPEVRKKLGNRGSYQTIQKHITQAEKEWFQNNKPEIGTAALRDQATTNLLNLVTTRIAEFTIVEYEALLQSKDKDIADLYHEKHEATEELAGMLDLSRSKVRDLSDMNDALLQKQEELIKERDALLNARDNLTRKLGEAQEKLKDCMNMQTLIELLSSGKHSVEELIKLAAQRNLTKEEETKQED